ncbi:uncharacterized protein LOC114294321 [Camellia sinensis]|uniref:uncharacterized protein LOC114294321 n=1 Tax=Camellia sinensis TaxID=4442 RepID=UPI001036B009|nr:uncharacterized protein LOC114294321 [Camellia sinensis]
MASSSTNGMRIRLKPRFCYCGRTASVHIVRTNENGNEGRVFFVCPDKYTVNEHCNYLAFADDDDNDVASTDIRTEEINELRRRVGEHDKRLERMEKILKAMTYVIVFCVFFYFIM